jgi:hypothetical protein
MYVWLRVLWTGVLTVSSRPTRYDALGLTCCPGSRSNHPPLKLLFFVLLIESNCSSVRSPLSSTVPCALRAIYLKRLGPFDSKPNDRRV